MPQKKIDFSERQLRFIAALIAKSRGGTSRSEVVRRALDAFIDERIGRGVITDADGGDLESVTDED